MRAVTLGLLIWLVPAVAAAQAPAAAQTAGTRTAGAAEQPPSPDPAPPMPPDNYTYQPDGRRDPFLTLIGAGTPQQRLGQRPAGPAGMSVDELSVRGILQASDTLIAMIQGPDNRAYVVHSGDKLLDGVIKAVTLQGLVIIQEVNDPLSLLKQREVIKRLRSQEDPK
jgi:Tfp pilus assembly protein PilP